jgi:predicted Zn-ribbon and HTH transcriptional regulator
MFRKDLIALLQVESRSVSSIARDLHLPKGDVEDDLRHLIRSARATGHDVVIEPAVCRACGFVFGDDRLAKPGRCPACRASRIVEAQIRIASHS